MSVKANLQTILSGIEAACRRCGRDPQTVRLVAVSKTKPAPLIEEAAAAGQTLFGESYVQEFVAKAEAITRPLQWHFIGALQSNKVKYIKGRTALIHSVDRYSLAAEIDRQWATVEEPAAILVQVNIGEETSKSGTSAEELEALVHRVSALPHLRIRGLMTLPPYCEDPEEVRPYFRRLRELARSIDALHLPGVTMEELSMGMSHDYVVAIEEGATLVRIGTAIFGERERN